MTGISVRFLSRLVLLAVALTVLANPGRASAHPMPMSSIVLDVGKRQVTGQIKMPLSRLALARRQALTPADAAGSQRAALEAYTAAHIRATATDGTAWAVRVGGGSVQPISSGPAFVVRVALTPPTGHAVSDFTLTYDVIIDQLVTHRALLAVRSDFRRGKLGGGATPVGIFDWDDNTLDVPASGGSWLRGMAAAARMGVHHVSTGSDHLLFLLMLLLPAPLVARGGRWRRGGSTKRSAIRVIHVVSAFALGHSTTLVLAGLGVVHVPERPVEALIALSIAVSALHALRPLVGRGEVLIAAGFGLVHGLAFASALGDLGLTRGSLVSTLLGFNIGIEITQLLVVALVMPSLVVLAGTRAYAPLRLVLGTAGLVLASSWMLERSGITASDPFVPVTQWAVDHPFVIAASIAGAALAARVALAERDVAGRGRPRIGGLVSPIPKEQVQR